jgi:hypothetical protein
VTLAQRQDNEEPECNSRGERGFYDWQSGEGENDTRSGEVSRGLDHHKSPLYEGDLFHCRASLNIVVPIAISMRMRRRGFST